MDKTKQIASSLQELYKDVNDALRYVSILGAMQTEGIEITDSCVENFYLIIEAIKRSYESFKIVFYAEARDNE